MIRLTFTKFIKQYQVPKDVMGLCWGTPLNDLANDIKDDPTFPKSIKSKNQLISYLQRHSACNEAIDAAHSAWSDFLKRKSGDLGAEPPIYKCKKKGNLLTFKCPMCREIHTHGVSKSSMPKNPEHRIAHCNDIRFHPDGYYIWF
jgi:uncharacterized protein YozE (UPF0346 family)